MSKDIPMGYKLTEVGVIPEDWKVSALGEICTSGSGTTPSRSMEERYFHNGIIPWVKTLDLNNAEIFETDERVTQIAINETSLKPYPVGTVLVAMYGGFNQIGRTGILRISAAVNQAITAVQANDSVISSDYLLRVLNYRVNHWKNVASSSRKDPNITSRDIKELKIAYPPLPEQEAIARVLSDTDALITSLDKLIAKKRDIKQAAMQQLLTGKQRLEGFGDSSGKFKQTEIGLIPEDWDVKTLKTISSMNGRIGWQGLKQEEFTFKEDDPFLITGMNFKDGKIRWEEVYHIPEKRYQEARNIQLKINDILMTKDGTIGKLLFVDEIPFPNKASLNSHLLVFRPLNQAYEPKFLFYQLDSKHFADHIDLNKSGSTFFGITQEAVGKYSAYLPPLEEQQAIAKVLSDMDSEISALEQRRDKTKALKQAMMQELLTGRIRLL